jgi:hypothetical protein
MPAEAIARTIEVAKRGTEIAAHADAAR